MRKIFAKIHLWLAVPFGLIITILCLTGAILVFESEIKEWTNPSLYKASEKNGRALPFPELVGTVRSQLPDTVSISSIQVPSAAGKNYRLGVEGQRRTSLFVDPYTGEVKGVSRPYAKGEFFTFVRRLHRWFLLQAQGPGISWGKMITGTTTLVFVFIILSGMMVWIPRTWKGVKKRLSIERGRGKFRFWHDFHLSLGQITALVLLVMTLTGLTWSFEWYRKGFYKVFGVEVVQEGGPSPHSRTIPEVDPAAGNTDQTGEGSRAGRERPQESEKEQGNLEDTEARERGSHSRNPERGEDPESRRGQGRANRPDGQQTVTDKYSVWEKAYSRVLSENPGARSITVQQGSVSVTLSNYGNTRAADRYTFDSRTAEITGVDYYKDQPKSSKIRGWIYSFHVGSWGGLFTRLLYFIVCLIGAALPLTGYYIWIKKRWKKWRKERMA